MTPTIAKSPRKITVSAYVDGDLKDTLQTIADNEDRPISYVVEKILQAYVEHAFKPAKKKAAK